MVNNNIVDIRSFKIPLSILILRTIEEYGYLSIDELHDVLYNKEQEYQIISEFLEIDTNIDFDNLGIREELDILAQLKLIKRTSGITEITDAGKKYLEIYKEDPKLVINKFYNDLRETNILFRIFCEKLEENNDGYVETIVLESSHPKANKPRVSYFIGLVTKQFKIAKREKNGIRLIRKIESPPVDIIAQKILSVYKRDIGTGLFLTIDYLWKEIKKEFTIINEKDFDNAISYLIAKHPGLVNGLSGVARKGDKVFVDKITKSIYQYLEIYSNLLKEKF